MCVLFFLVGQARSFWSKFSVVCFLSLDRAQNIGISTITRVWSAVVWNAIDFFVALGLDDNLSP